jgi:uncharacterized Zn-finger protein
MSFNCQFCNKEFSTKSNLTYHQRTANFCLQIQGKDTLEAFSCQLCDKKFNRKSSCMEHECICPQKKINNNEKLKEIEKDNQQLKEEIVKFKKDIEYYSKQILEKDKKIEKLEDTIIGIAEAKHEILKSNCIDNQVQELAIKYGRKQRRQQIKDPNVVYILTTNHLKNERRYILGKSKNLTTRLSTYNKTDEHEVIYHQGCGTEENMDAVEKMVLTKLTKYREVENRDRFILPEDKEIDLFIDTIKNSVEFILN